MESFLQTKVFSSFNWSKNSYAVEGALIVEQEATEDADVGEKLLLLE